MLAEVGIQSVKLPPRSPTKGSAAGSLLPRRDRQSAMDQSSGASDWVGC